MNRCTDSPREHVTKDRRRKNTGCTGNRATTGYPLGKNSKQGRATKLKSKAVKLYYFTVCSRELSATLIAQVSECEVTHADSMSVGFRRMTDGSIAAHACCVCA